MSASLRVRFVAPLVMFALGATLLSCTGSAKRANAVRGKQLFDSTCDVCHYANSETARAGPGLKGLYTRKWLPNGKPVSDENLDRFIRTGDHLMPGYKDAITPDQMRDLIAYLKTL